MFSKPVNIFSVFPMDSDEKIAGAKWLVNRLIEDRLTDFFPTQL